MILRSLKLRNVDRPCVLSGPTLSRFCKYSLSLKGLNIIIRCPNQKTKLPVKAIYPNSNEYNSSRFFEKLIGTKDGWKNKLLSSLAWDFYGPLFGGELGTVIMSISVIQSTVPNQDTSFFHPRAFELATADLLNYYFGDEFVKGHQCWLAPIEWTTLKNYQAVAAKFTVQPSNERPQKSIWMLTPISNSQFLSVRFNLSWNHVSLTSEHCRPKHDISKMEKLCHDIMDSLEITLSEQALAQQQDALKDLEDTSLVKEYPPLKWEENQEASV